MLVDFLSSHGLLSINEMDGPTYSGPTGYSWIDITVSSSELARKIQDWRVREENTLSDHSLILFSLRTQNYASHLNRTTSHPTRRFANKVGNWELFQLKVLQIRQKWVDLLNNPTTKEQLDTAVTTIWDYLGEINKTCFLLPIILTENQIRPMVVSKTKRLKETSKRTKMQSQKIQKPGSQGDLQHTV